MPWTLTLDDESYETACERFAWDFPDEYNLAADLVGKHDPESPALHQAYPDGRRKTYTFRRKASEFIKSPPP